VKVRAFQRWNSGKIVNDRGGRNDVPPARELPSQRATSVEVPTVWAEDVLTGAET